jgi:murein DD-endopeptidase MepM/ murein hydrolase activator NlpD
MDEILGVSLTKLKNLDDPSELTNGTPTSPGGSGLVSADGYAFPLEPQTKAVGGINNSHHDGTPAFDLFSSTPDPEVYAISDGTVDTVNTNFNDVRGCTSIQFRSVDGFWYWHGHLKNPVVQRGDVVRAGDKLAEVADASFGSRCVGGAPHLHIDRGCVRNGVPQRGGTDACRDPDFIPFLRSIWEGLPNG